ncbi:hypothetical protein FA10DRAFT_153433 [Acaromyces ingoldii]|uniref:Uncharacterized protein n=1 Tax=Acaromyces ingoldii TaxID=215250 RepID=A0A316YER8_9BASI|nr:hypothetical protein FA10DRAFT_153433 [Acaromyces ingoldii]PWN88060.1 hypothetical protein FA10DRAFT_153433 [Acaromyces ingoldii]
MRQEQPVVQTTEATNTSDGFDKSQIATTQQMLDGVSGLKTMPPTLATCNQLEPIPFSSTENIKSFDSPTSSFSPAAARMASSSSSSSSEVGHNHNGKNSTTFGWDVTTMDSADGALMRNTWIESAIASFNNGNHYLATEDTSGNAWPKEQRAFNANGPFHAYRDNIVRERKGAAT